ncbi:hypothetical protein [Streptomyces telluris]|uniref:Uncharacterized protein n=1 Tax=Streptomyces telluris TaxID=2720021 RepID=A0A9X2RLN4_9ACTN|nr:hypothetical protein [Streptomyces telluris]MCQ8768526.1 hypothetical protein [Streptomyces telluris]NJP80411.1 hypothetical protein [Streptomyces telluris]
MHEAWYRVLSIAALVVGVWEGPLSIVYRLVSDDEGTVLRAANYLPSPWCYVVATAAALLTFGVLAVLDAGREKALARQSAA